MGWMQKCYNTYENNVALAGKSGERETLCMIAHMNATAQLEITLNQEGEFVNAEVLEKESGRTLIPVTESSAGRASGVAPHALCDTLSYVAGDYSEYLQSDKEINRAEQKYEAYRNALKAWCDSEYTCSKIRIIYTYIEKACMIRDLIEHKIIKLEGDVFSSQKISGQAYEKALVRFRVLGEIGQVEEVWRDKDVINNYIQYTLNMLPGKSDICYVSAKEGVIATNHPKGIVAANYGAKLISANDGLGYTYRGRFVNAEEAYAISYEVSQKAHAALHWVVANQGVTIGNTDKRTFVCWNPEGRKVINPFQIQYFQDKDTEDDEIPHTALEYKKKLRKTLMGYRQELGERKDIVVMGLDAATTGRLSITYYNELMGSDFYDRIQEWYQSFVWYFTGYDNGKRVSEVRTPSMREIIQYAYGTVDSTGGMQVSDKLYKEQMQRMLRCMLDKQPLPRDLVHALFLKASSPQAYSNKLKNIYECILSTACAAIKKRKNDNMFGNTNINTQEREDNIMTLDENNRNRSYLFGRLLAIAETVELLTYSYDEKREPNAKRYQTVFVHHPMSTWKILEEALEPYYRKIDSPKKREEYRTMIQGIIEKIEDDDATKLNNPLDENYLLGYYLQRATLRTKNDK